MAFKMTYKYRYNLLILNIIYTMILAFLTLVGSILWLLSGIYALESTGTSMTEKNLAIAAPACFVLVAIINCFGVCTGRRIL